MQAASGVAKISRPSKLATLGEEVLAEATLRDELKTCDSAVPQELTQAERQLSQLLRAGRLITGPLKDSEQKCIGAWIVVDDGTAGSTPRATPLIEQCISMAPVVSGITSLLESAKPSAPRRMWMRLREATIEKHRGACFLVIAVLSALLTIPRPYNIRCDCELHPVTRRYVPAPYDGQLNEVLVEPGAIVVAGQILARMDKRELEWRLASLDAEYHRARKQRDSSLATRETSSAQVARLEMERLNGERKLLRNQLTKLEIRSPIDGMVLAGDPKKLEGARLTIGQSLFETGPLDRMLVEVFVPDDEIAFLQSGNDVSVRLDALPLRTFTGTIRRVNPKSESRNNQNVFIAEVVLENPDRLLRPGMNGRARISTPAQMLGWNLFRKPIVRLVRLVRW